MGLQVSSIIFLDSPVGTGFSYSTCKQALKTSDIKSSVDVHTFLRKVYIYFIWNIFLHYNQQLKENMVN